MAKTRITLVGCGPTGIVLGLALKSALKDVEIIGNDKDRDAIRRAETAKAIDKGEWNIPSACENAAAILISTPPDEFELVLKAINTGAQFNTLVCTIGGHNVGALRLASQHLPADVPFFASTLVLHPDRVGANTEPASYTADTLKSAMWTIAPRTGTSPDMVDVFAALVTELGANPVFVDPIERDGLGVAVDALPPIVSSMLMLAVSNDGAWRERQWMAGAQFGAATANVDAAAALGAELVAQPDAAVHWLNQIMLQCMALRDAVRERDEKAVQKILDQAIEKRNKWLADWRRGRDDGRQPVQKQSTVLSLFVGERMADKLTGNKKR